MKAAVVVGASGGIGRAIAEQLSANYHVIALSRCRPGNWPDDNWISVDIRDEASLAEAARQLPLLTRIIVATGRLPLPPEKSTRALTLESMTMLFAINAAGPALVAKHLLPLTPKAEPSVFAALSARVGSIGDNNLGGWHSYRTSKAALNMLIRTIAIEHRRTRPLGICVALHPGTVDTELSAAFPAHTKFTPAQSAAALLKVMDSLPPEATGNFYAWDGSPIPW